MQTYKEYPIRCKTCGEQIAAFAPQYEELLRVIVQEDRIAQMEALEGAEQPTIGTLNHPLNELNIAEKALNRLGITEWCSRSAMLNPTFVRFNMENRAVIEGIENVDAAVEADAQKESEIQPIFASCKGPNTNLQFTSNQALPPKAIHAALPASVQAILPIPEAPQPAISVALPTTPGILPTAPIGLLSGLVPMTQTRTTPNAPGVTTGMLPTALPGLVPRPPTTFQVAQPQQISRPGLQTIELQRPVTRVEAPVSVAGLNQLMAIKPLEAIEGLPEIQTTLPSPSNQPLGAIAPIEAINLETGTTNTGLISTAAFQEPVMVGVPTINASQHPTSIINVGAGAQVIVLTGRTYLAE